MNEKDNDNNKFKSCNVGYYLPEFEKNKCQKCSIDNCFECYGNKTSNICTKCKNHKIIYLLYLLYQIKINLFSRI